MTTPYSEGDPNAPILIVAEAPAKWEMVKGRPLVGESGRVFEECLHAAGLIRREVQIANVSRRPIKGGDSLVTKSGSFTEEGKEALADFQGRLCQTKPRVIVPMGNIALTACTGEYGITKWRGSPLRLDSVYPGSWAVPTFHPASTLPGRGPFTNRYTIVSDLKKARRFAEDPNAGPPARTLHIHPTISEVESYLSQLDGDDMTFAFDIEILNFQVSCISFSHDPLYAMSIPFVGDVWGETDEAHIWRLIAGVFANPRCTAVAHNAMFDVSFLYLQNAIRILNKIHCTMVMHRILYPDFPAKLEFVTSTYTDEPYYKDDKQIWTRPWEDPDTFFRYNCRDSAVCIEAYYPLAEEIYSDIDYHWTYENTMSLFEPCLYMMSRGVRIDLDRLAEVKKDVQGNLGVRRRN
jgi:uracil-DNA glycosylase family 4